MLWCSLIYYIILMTKVKSRKKTKDLKDLSKKKLIGIILEQQYLLCNQQDSTLQLGSLSLHSNTLTLKELIKTSKDILNDVDLSKFLQLYKFTQSSLGGYLG